MLRPKTTLIVFHRAEVFDDHEYHFVLMPDGLRRTCVPFTDKGAHAYKANSYAVGIAVFGNFAHLERSYHPEPTAAQIDAAVRLVHDLEWWFGGPLPIKGHSELKEEGTTYPEKLIPGHDCPGSRGDLMGQLRRRLGK